MRSPCELDLDTQPVSREVSSLPLTVLDTQFLGKRPLALALLSRGKPDVERLYQSLRTALASRSLYSARVRATSGGPRLEFEGDAVPFCVNKPDSRSLSDIDSNAVESLVDYVPSQIDGEVISMCVTPLRDGYAVGFSCSHVAGDVRAAVLFGRAFGQAYAGHAVEPHSPQRTFVLGDEQLRELVPRTVTEVRRAQVQVPCPSGVHEEIVLGHGEVESTRIRVGGAQHAAVTALLVERYRDALFARRDAIRMRTPVDLRPVTPGLDPNYLGNAFLDAIAELSIDDAKAGPSTIAAKVGESLRRVVKSVRPPSPLLRIGRYGLEPTSAWQQDVTRFDPERDAAVTSLVNRLSAMGPDLGAGPSDICVDAFSTRSFVVRTLSTGDVGVTVRL